MRSRNLLLCRVPDVCASEDDDMFDGFTDKLPLPRRMFRRDRPAVVVDGDGGRLADRRAARVCRALGGGTWSGWFWDTGLAASILLFVVVRLWTTRREAAHALAKKLSASYRQSEESLRKARDELQWNVQRRMDELSLTNQVLQEEIGRRIQAEILLENKINQLNQVNADLNDFAYIVSHDLRAPLRAIGSLAHWIYEDNAAVLNDEGRENLETLSGRVRRMDALINGILQYSRIGRIEPAREVFDSHKICREVIDSLAPPEGIVVRIDGHAAADPVRPHAPGASAAEPRGQRHQASGQARGRDRGLGHREHRGLGVLRARHGRRHRGEALRADLQDLPDPETAGPGRGLGHRADDRQGHRREARRQGPRGIDAAAKGRPSSSRYPSSRLCRTTTAFPAFSGGGNAELAHTATETK